MVVLVIDRLDDEGAIDVCIGHLLEEGRGGGCIDERWGWGLVRSVRVVRALGGRCPYVQM